MVQHFTANTYHYGRTQTAATTSDRKANSRVHSLHFRFILLHFKIHYNDYVTLMQTPRMSA